MARAKKARAIRKRNVMNQLRCQIGISDSEWICDSLYMIRVDPVCCEEDCFLRDSPCCCEPEEATVYDRLKNKLVLVHFTSLSVIITDSCFAIWLWLWLVAQLEASCTLT